MDLYLIVISFFLIFVFVIPIILISIKRGRKENGLAKAPVEPKEESENASIGRKEINLHFGRTNYSSNNQYAEFSFYACFGEVFNTGAWSEDTEFKGDELFNVLDKVKIRYNKELIFEKYANGTNHDVEVFHADDDEQVFAYFDLQKDPTDQNGMFMFGLTCKKEDESAVHALLLDIYRKLKTSSPFLFENRATNLYNKVFLSYDYFYDGKYNPGGRQLNHHNLKIGLRLK